MIYLDNASTTKLNSEIKNEILKSLDCFYNPSASYGVAIETKNKIINAKKSICKALGASFNENLIITGSATEANNLALMGSLRKKFGQIIISEGEHPSVYNCALQLKSMGYEVNFVKLNQDGTVNINHFKELLKKETSFVSIMHVNNETGAINDIKLLRQITKEHWENAIFHSDGVQAFGKIPVNLSELDVDYYSISAHKIGGPKGIGTLYCKNAKKLKSIIYGGGQEYGIRSGTENVSFILSFGKLCENLNQKNNYEYVIKLNKSFRKFFENKPNIIINSSNKSSPFILSLAFKGVRGETLLHALESEGIIVGTGSACSSKKIGLNRTLQAMNISKDIIEDSIRISFFCNNTINEVEEACNVIYNKYKDLRDKLS